MTIPEKKPAKKKVTKPKAAPRKPVVKKKPVVAAAPAAPIEQPTTPHTPRSSYLYAVGRRKTAVARVRLHKRGGGIFEVNGKPLEQYFPTPLLQGIVRQPLETTGIRPGMITVKVVGGGQHSQAESVRHGLARVLLLVDQSTRIPLKRAGLLTRDPRVKERKKYGLKRARRAPQWQKR